MNIHSPPSLTKKLNKTIIIGDTIGLPIGYAASTRTLFIASALSKTGMEVDILLIKPSESTANIKNTQTNFSLCEISVHYTSGTTTISDNWFGRRWQSLIGLFNACKHIFINRKECLTIIIYSRNIEVIFIIGLFSKLFKITAVLELCEWPVTQTASNYISALKKKFFCSYSLTFVDGAIYISQYIRKKIERYEARTKRKISKFHLPILCDSEEFKTSSNNKIIAGQVVYCGNLSYRPLLGRTLKIIRDIIDINNSVHLLIVGSSDNKEDLLYLTQLIKHYNLDSKVTRTGFVSRRELIKIYKTAYAFLLPLENDDLSAARFPTKLAEYLLSGRPVVAPNVGEISFFLKKNITFVAPLRNSTTDFTASLLHLLSDSQFANEVGREGKKVADHFFDYRQYSTSLSNWLHEITNENSKKTNFFKP